MSSAAALSCCASCGAIYKHDYPRCPADGAEIIQTDRDPLLGTTVGGYVVDSLIGEGGMGRVYLAHREGEPATRFAIKVMLGDLAATVKARKRFVQEAEKLARVNSPNVVGVVAHGATNGALPYIVLEYLAGKPVSDMLAAGPMPVEQVVAIARQVAEGLRAAHAAGIVHRDLKPDNVLVSTVEGREVAHIIDFGLAVADDARDTRLTSTGLFMATPAYAAPEQMTGSVVDHRADLYALGTSVFEMLTGGKVPFDGTLEAMALRTRDEAPRLSAVVPELNIPEPLQDLIASLLKRRAEERPQDARTVVAALDALTRAPQPVPRARPSWLVPVLACAAAAIVAVAVFGVTKRSEHASEQVVRMQATDASAPVVVSDAAVVAVAPAMDAAPADEVSAPPVVPAPTSPGRRRPPARSSSGRTPPKVRTSVATPIVVPTVPPPPPPPVPKPVLHASLAGIDVNGALSAAEVRRAVGRLVPAFERCAPGDPATVTARFSVGEHRRAENVSTTGAAAGTNQCVAAAIAGLRTESAPDVGDVSVTARVQFSAAP